MLTKVQQRTSGPHRGGIPFARGSLFHLLKNPVYRGKIVHKGRVYDGEHEAIVSEELWNAVQAQLAKKAPPRKRATNEPQQAMLRGLLTDLHSRPMVPTYGSSKVKRYAYYETRKDLARPGDPPGIRFQRGHLEQHLVTHLEQLLNDEHALRRVSAIDEAGALRTMFATAHLFALQLREMSKVEHAVRSLVALITIRGDCMAIVLKPGPLGIDPGDNWAWSIPLPVRRPFREARLRIDSGTDRQAPSNELLGLVANAMAVQRLVLASPELSLAQLAKREGRCRTQLTRLLRLSWMSPRIIEAIVGGTQPKALTRRALLISEVPVDWTEQERQFGLPA